MSAKRNIHGSKPEHAPVVLLMVDWINDLEFPEGGDLLPFALPAARRAAALKKRCRAAGIPTIYVNDNFGRWRSDFSTLVKHCLEDGVRGREMVELLVPDEEDYFVLKPTQSGFFSTSLQLLLRYLEAKTLIITGLAGNLCMMHTVHDAYLYDYEIYVPADTVASESAEENDSALRHMERFLKADVRPAASLRLKNLGKIKKR